MTDDDAWMDTVTDMLDLGESVETWPVDLRELWESARQTTTVYAARMRVVNRYRIERIVTAALPANAVPQIIGRVLQDSTEHGKPVVPSAAPEPVEESSDEIRLVLLERVQRLTEELAMAETRARVYRDHLTSSRLEGESLRAERDELERGMVLTASGWRPRDAVAGTGAPEPTKEHTRGYAGANPDVGQDEGAYCVECSASAQDYVWPCTAGAGVHEPVADAAEYFFDDGQYPTSVEEAMTLADFLLARIAEDEAVAKSANMGVLGGGNWDVRSDTGGLLAVGVTGRPWNVAYRTAPEDAPHIARWDPARVLAECEAHRRILAMWREVEPYGGQAAYEAHMGGWRGALEDVLLCLSLPYADHPDFDPAWGSA